LAGAGRLFLDEARSVLACAEAAERALREIAGLRRGALAVQASQTIADYWRRAISSPSGAPIP
jgi:DNA-binding transcriptional LysR family regulator